MSTVFGSAGILNLLGEFKGKMELRFLGEDRKKDIRAQLRLKSTACEKMQTGVSGTGGVKFVAGESEENAQVRIEK